MTPCLKKNAESFGGHGHIMTYDDISSIKSEESQQAWEFAGSEIESFTVFLVSGMAI